MILVNVKIKTADYTLVSRVSSPLSLSTPRGPIKIVAETVPADFQRPQAFYDYKPHRYKREALRLWLQRCNTAKPTRCYNGFPQVDSNRTDLSGRAI
jgi:hypothetical protein